jgi:hypothetical protein
LNGNHFKRQECRCTEDEVEEGKPMEEEVGDVDGTLLEEEE